LTGAGPRSLKPHADHRFYFHAISPEFDFKIAIADCSIISGNGRLRGRDLAAIRAWGQKHRDRLYDNWQLARDGQLLRDIED
jgi:hypothetical protein